MVKRGVFVFVVLVLFLLALISLAENETLDFRWSEEALLVNQSLAEARQNLQEIQEAGLPIIRYNDTLDQAEIIYQVKLNGELNGIRQDYSTVSGLMDDLRELKNNIFKSADELSALKLQLEGLSGVDLAPIEELYQQAEAEFKTERYEACLDFIDQTTKKISEQKAVTAKLKVFYEATSRTLGGFFKKWWLELLITITIIAVVILLTYNQMIMLWIKERIVSLERRKKSVRNLIAKTQEEYFEKGTMSDDNYRIKVNKYGQYIRDINRQLSILREDLLFRKAKKSNFVLLKEWVRNSR